MRLRNPFSIIEMMTVVFIILLLMSLLIPTFQDLKMNARNSICKGQLRQIGTLITSYTTDQNGFLPNDTANPFTLNNGLRVPSDIPVPPKKGYYDAGPNNNLYGNWNGHLLPYIDVNLPDKYTRYAMVTKIGSTRFSSTQLGSGVENPPPANVLTNGWAVIDDAYRIGGHQDLKVFICPEIHQNTFDVGAAIKFNGIKIPRIQQLCTGGITGFGAFSDTKGYDYGMAGGIPTTYLANSRFFGQDNIYSSTNINSYRIDQINEISNKAFLLEGGVADAFGGYSYGNQSNGAIGATYYNVGSTTNDGGDLSGARLNKDMPQLHKLSFMHDNYDKFWLMKGTESYTYWPNMWWGRNTRLEVIAKFNANFAPKAYMVEDDEHSSSYHSCSIISYVDPAEYAPIFKKFFDTHTPGVQSLRPFIAFTDTPNDFSYLTGNTNVLFGDGSVVTKDQAWLYNNRRSIGGLTE